MARATLHSMTGYGEAERDLDLGRLRVEVRTVNHRYLNLQLRTPPGFDRHQRRLEQVLKDHFSRGHVQVGIVLDRSTAAEASGSVEIDVDRARGYVEALRALQSELGLQGHVDIGTLSRFRDVFRETEGEDPDLELPVEPVAEVLAEAARKVREMRAEEGARLATDLAQRLSAMEIEIDAIGERAPDRLVEERDRLRDAIRTLLDGEVEVDEERIGREIAHLAERWDIHEELVRFRSHVEMFRETMESGDLNGVGKRFGFIAQELLREANTIGSKANDAQIARRVVTLKEEIERLREQLENVE